MISDDIDVIRGLFTSQSWGLVWHISTSLYFLKKFTSEYLAVRTLCLTLIGLIQLCLTWKVEYCPPALLILKLYSALKRNGYHTNSFVLKKNAAWVHNIQVLPRSQIETTWHHLFILIQIKMHQRCTTHAETLLSCIGKRNLFFS